MCIRDRFSTNVHLELRDWSLDPELLLDAQDMYHAATVEAHPDGEKVLRRPDPYDEPTPTYEGSYIMLTKSEWLAKHVRLSLHAYKDAVGIHPTYSLEAVSHLALREKLFKYILKKRVLSYAASSDPPWGRTKPVRSAPTHKCLDCGELLRTAEGLHLHRIRKHPDTYKEGIGI